MVKQCDACEIVLPDAVTLESLNSKIKPTYEVKFCPVCGENAEEWS